VIFMPAQSLKRDVFAMRLAPTMRQQLDTAAAARGVTASELARVALVTGLSLLNTWQPPAAGAQIAEEQRP
jgi:hypothetical protein